jgi:rhodanese-related sulfurtransferase
MAYMAHELTLRESSAPGGLAATRVSAEEVLARMGRGEPIVFVDARREPSWRSATEKIPGAYRLGPRQDETLPLIPRGRAIVTYCTCAHEASSAWAAETLLARGYADVHPLYGGLAAWRFADGPLQAR